MLGCCGDGVEILGFGCKNCCVRDEMLFFINLVFGISVGR